MKDSTLAALRRVVSDLDAVATAIRTETDQVVATGDHVEVIKHFAHLRSAVEQTKTAREAMAGIADNLSRVTIPDIFRALREKTGQKPPFIIEGVGRVTVANKFSASIVDHPVLGKEPGYDWLRENGHGSLIQNTVNSSTLSAFAKNMLEENGVELPTDLFKTGVNPYTSITKI